MLAAGSRLVMDAMILSEYLNRYCRIEWNALHKVAYPEFKDFRKSAAFLPVGQAAATFARNMLKLCTRHDHPFAAADVTQVLADFEAGSNDFNDGLLAETCRHHNWKLVTGDGDFTVGGIEVLTTNPKLLAACP
jgi:predicted nucleic acid-binding protein